MADVFLSYARASEERAQRIAAALRSAGFSVWFDEGLPAHRPYSEVIEEQLEAAKAVIVLWTREGAASQWVRSEANRARESGRLIQARLDETRLPMPFDQIQCADLSRWSGDPDAPAWRSVVESLGALTAGERQPSALPRLRRGRPASRRALLVGGGAVAVAAIAGVGFWSRRPEPHEELTPQAQLLMQKGFDALQDNDALDPGGPGSTMQAIALLSQATEAAPKSAIAWGGLALAYAVRKKTVPLPERPGLDMRSRAAAKRSLDLDPSEGRALGALLLLDPIYRHWLESERAHREALRKNKSIPLLFSMMSNMLGNVGRWRDATGFSSHIDRQHFLIPGAERKFIVDSWAAGDLQTADDALQTAVEHWPQHPEIWRTRVVYLMYSGRPGDALDLLREGAERPTQITEDLVRANRATAQALAGRRPAASAVAEVLAYLADNPAAALDAANACGALGAVDECFEILDGYYFDEGKWKAVAPRGGDEDRITNALFLPPMRAIWRDARFARLLQRTDLNDYWRRSGTVPDFRVA